MKMSRCAPTPKEREISRNVGPAILGAKTRTRKIRQAQSLLRLPGRVVIEENQSPTRTIRENEKQRAHRYNADSNLPPQDKRLVDARAKAIGRKPALGRQARQERQAAIAIVGTTSATARLDSPRKKCLRLRSTSSNWRVLALAS